VLALNGQVLEAVPSAEKLLAKILKEKPGFYSPDYAAYLARCLQQGDKRGGAERRLREDMLGSELWTLERVVGFMPLERPRRRALLRALKKGVKSFKLAPVKFTNLSPGALEVMDQIRNFLESIFGDQLGGKDVFRDKSEGTELHEWFWLRWEEGDDRQSNAEFVIELYLRGMILVSPDVGADHPCLL
jgi:hypothetical protein